MRQLLIGDCHFGTSSNSVIWLEDQLRFFNTQFIEVLNSKNIDRVVFLGDLFDIRFSINQQVGMEVKNLIRKIITDYPLISFYFVAGNHDFYSPLEEFHSYNAYDITFGYEFEKYYPNVKFIVYGEYFENGDLFLPWYSTDNFQTFTDTILKYNQKIKNIYCHTDLSQWGHSYTTLLPEDVKVWSGHIHYMWGRGNFHNLGAMFPFNFGDVNSSRYMYILEDEKIVDKIENVTTPKFKRYFNEDIFTLTDDDFNNTFIEIVISTSNSNKASYIERSKEIKAKYLNPKPRFQYIDDASGETLELSYFNANINEYILRNTPEHLKDKYDYITEKIKTKASKD